MVASSNLAAPTIFLALGVKVAQMTLTHLVLVRIHEGQPNYNMNVSHKLKLIWFAPPRTASRALHGLLQHYDFVNLVEGVHADLRKFSHTHVCKIPVNLEYYNILLQVRNPYSKIVSLWHLDNYNRSVSDPGFGKKSDTFTEFVYDSLKLHCQKNNFEKLPTFVPKYLIRYENFAEDVLKLDFIDFKDKFIIKEYNRLILNNNFLYERKTSPTEALDSKHANWRQHYTQELAEVIYDAAEQHFVRFGYDKDSWKNT